MTHEGVRLRESALSGTPSLFERGEGVIIRTLCMSGTINHGILYPVNIYVDKQV